MRAMVLSLVVVPSLLALALAGPARAQINVAVDPTQDVHAISPLVYGMNFADGARVAAGGITATRWGGNSTTRYNYQIDVSNTGADYYFENIAGCWNPQSSWCATPPTDPQAQSGANRFLDGAMEMGLTALLTIPTIGWVAKPPPAYSHPFACGCPRSADPTQDSYDPYDTNCGNGRRGGAWIQCPAPETTSIATDSSWAGAWVAYVVAQHGPAAGARVYEMDNEPNLWSSTHHDVHPARLTYDELWARMRDYGAAVMQADPTAEVAGPAEWGWPNYFCSDADTAAGPCSVNSPDRAAHGGEELVAWLLDQARAYENATGTRILHYLDLHYYPQGGSPPAITRSLWDSSYVDPSWIRDTIRLIPRMRDWVSQHYPGTKLMVSEYDFYHHNEAVGALTYAEVLGLFGREGLDAATAWAPPAPAQAAFQAYALYRNFDGQGAAFESTSVRATVSGGSGVEAYAATSASRATVALVNETVGAVTVTVSFGAFVPADTARLFTASGGASIQRQPDVTLQAGMASVTLPGMSIGMLEVNAQAAGRPAQPKRPAMRPPSIEMVWPVM